MLLFLAVALLSAGALAYEVLLPRLFSIVQWHHYAYMIISIALARLRRERCLPRARRRPASPPLRCGFWCRRRPVRYIGGRELCGGRALTIQCARRDLAAAAASLSSHPLHAVCGAVLRRGHLHRARARRIPGPDRSNLSLRPDRRRRRRHRPDAGAIRALSRHGAQACRSAWPSRGGARDQPARERDNPEEPGGRLFGCRDCSVRRPAVILDGTAPVRI